MSVVRKSIVLIAPRCPAWLRLALSIALVASTSSPALGQFLRLGPLDFGAETQLEGVYTTNVDQERESEAVGEMEDYYVIWGFDLNGVGNLTPNTQLRLDTGISIEKHFVREDLDNSESPFGHARLAAQSEMGYLSLRGEAYYENTIDADEEEFVPGGREKRDVQNEYGYLGGAVWSRGPFSTGLEYEFVSERHEDEEFQDGDQDETTITYDASWKVNENMSVRYELERTKTVLINSSDGDGPWLDTETISLDGLLQIIERPRLTYSLGLEKEDSENADGSKEEGEWEPVHTLRLSDDRDISPTMNLSGYATYEYEQDPEEDDISFTYGVALAHEISSTARQSFRFEREPVDTFGSKTDTDETTYSWNFQKKDLLIYNLNLVIDISYDISEPLDGASPTEKTLTYEVELMHVTQLTRSTTRQLMYEYYLEDVDIEPETIEEHRVTLSYVYTF